MQIDIHDRAMKKVGSVEVPDGVFGCEVNQTLLWEQAKAQRASRRRGTHATKRRGEVSGTGAKPFKQKGSGRARQGSNRAPNHVGGGIVFGPQPRDYSYRLPRSARRAALRSALSLRAQEKSLFVLDGFDLSAPKTKEVTEFLNALGSASALIVDQENGNLQLSIRNLPKAKFLAADAINPYDILNHEKLVVVQRVLDRVVERADRTASGQKREKGEAA